MHIPPPITHIIIAPAHPIEKFLTSTLAEAGIEAQNAYQFRQIFTETSIIGLVEQLRQLIQSLVREQEGLTFHVMLMYPQPNDDECQILEKLIQRILAHFISTQNGFLTVHGFEYSSFETMKSHR
ncbi:hypothetical protein KC571_03595 [candidate division WWE3 bacterium]|uniref:Uncharacterized protein n=1 Tax=candidate division WWE3 bacterium TaxID=2053526 RepID=A0A955RQF5_UNCKA|nr:hypothetical protein [candidate division WWE3 bacterium]